ncbi:hypothetical protein [Aquimarina longa]|uniref:hypothetical protein n=1 Tax=Aquimarina longa TaxID=1080221 RepID=UPI000784D270|nr:hypothetical protein [Aquimarina longa]
MTLGDIIELEQDGKKVYCQYLKEVEDDNTLEGVRIFYDVYTDRPKNIESVIKDDFFFLKLPLKYGIKEKGVTLMDNVPLPKDLAFPKSFRRENMFGSGWRILFAEGGSEVVEELSEEQKKYPPYGHWNIPEIFENLENGWRLENWI